MVRPEQIDHGMASGSGLAKITFELPQSDWHDHARESVWAQPAGVDLYEVRNVPFYAGGIGYGDIVHTRAGQPFPVVDGVVEPSGHSTYRVISNGEVFARRWPTLSVQGCTYERATADLVAVDVPADADIDAVYRALEEGERAGDWDFEEGHCSHGV
jgi:hypothetical protein